MKFLNLITMSIGILAVSATITNGAELTELTAKELKNVATQLVTASDQIKNPQVAIEADPEPEHAYGLKIEQDGVVIIPARGLKEDSLPETVKTETGAGFAYLFLSEEFSPLVNGQPVDESAVRIVKITDDEGTERRIKCLLLAARQFSEDDWSLYAYGTAKKPLTESKFEESTPGDETRTIALKVTDVQENQGKLVVLLFGKYQASLEVRYIGE